MVKQEAESSIDLDKLFEIAMKGDWDKVVQAYTYSSGEIIENHKASGGSAKQDTALHVAVAVANDETEHVSEIIKGIPDSNLLEILRMKNCMGCTPLHLAAANGNLDICHSIASKDKSLIAETNNEGETPLFLAAHRGHEDAFLYLESMFGKKDVARCMVRNSTGNTILHSAISGGDYWFAIRIVESYPDLVNSVNNEGLTPLHVLALQPHSFKSSVVQLGLFDLIFYRCMFIRTYPLEDHGEKKFLEEIERIRNSRKHPQNYRTCCDVYDMLNFKKMFACIFEPKSTGISSNICHLINQPDSRITVCVHLVGRGSNNARDATDNKGCLEGGFPGLIKKETGEDSTDGKKGTKANRPSTTICDVLFRILMFISFVPFHFLVSERLLSIAHKKRKHKLAEQLLKELLQNVCTYKSKEQQLHPVEAPSSSCITESTTNEPVKVTELGNDQSEAGTAVNPPGKKEKQHRQCKKDKQQLQSSEPCVRGETPLLTAARLGIVEMVRAILKKFPKAIEDEDNQKKNAVLLAAENRQSRVYRLLENERMVHESIFSQVDAHGNSALHLASLYNPNQPWSTPGPALQMKWELTWHQYVKNSMPSNFFVLRNKDRKTAQEIFKESHEDLKKEAHEWLSTTSTAYSVISTLIATVAFATSATIPGEYDQGKAVLEHEFAFSVFSIASLIALCTSMSATVFFIAILTTRYEQEDFAVKLPGRLQFGLTFLFASIASILVSFGSGFYFSVRNKLENAAYPIFAVMCLPVTLFAAAQLPLFVGLNDVIFFSSRNKIKHYEHVAGVH